MSDKMFQTCRDYEMAYWSGCKGTEVKVAVKSINHIVECSVLIAKDIEYDGKWHPVCLVRCSL